jgi:hypothetical protein
MTHLPNWVFFLCFAEKTEIASPDNGLVLRQSLILGLAS